MQNARLNESQAGIKTVRRNINNLRYADDTILNGRKWRGTKEPLDEGERGEWKSWLKTQHSKNRSWHPVPRIHCKWKGKSGSSDRFYLFSLVPKSLQMVTAATKLKDIYSWEGKLWQTCVLYLVAQSCLTLCNPMDCSLSGSSVHGDSPGQHTGVGCHALLQGIFPTQRSNPGFLHCRRIL